MIADRSVSRRSAKRWLVAVACAVAAVALVGGGWLAATVFTSPEQRDAAAAAPSAVPVLVPVELGDLLDTRTLSGEIRATEAYTAALVAPTGSSRSVITSVNAVGGTEVDVGSLIATVNGQPVFAFASPFPFYRDLGSGDTGPDVQALQEGLSALGLLGGVDGTFGPATEKAVGELFTQHGFVAPHRDRASTDAGDTEASGKDESTNPALARRATPVTYFPFTAGLTVPSLPARVSTAPQVGSELGNATTFAFVSQSLAIFATIPESLPEGLATGSEVTVTGAGLDAVAGTVSLTSTANVAPVSGDDASSANGIGATATPDGSSERVVRINLTDPTLLTVERSNQPVTVSVVVKTIATAALIVPITAVAESGPGHDAVLRARPEGGLDRASVTILGTAGGRVAIAPGGELSEHDKVRVG